MRYLLALLIFLVARPVWAEPEPSILNPSGLPIPRFVSLKFDEINLRVGPGKRYPIKWVYHRKNMPVQIVEEFAHWRKIRDFEGTSGWVHKGAVDGARTAMVVTKLQNLYAKPDATSATVLKAQPLVIGKLLECAPDWCQVEISERKGWILKTDIWGVTREEVFAK